LGGSPVRGTKQISNGGDRHNAQGEHAHVTVFLFTGEQITEIVHQSEPLDHLEPSPVAA